MPIFELNTNVPVDKVPTNLATNLTNVVASALGKPASYVVVQINAGANLLFGGTAEPAGNARLTSIGQINRQKNKETSKKISAVLENELGIVNNRLYIEFVDLHKENVGYSGTTFDDLL